MGMGAPEEKFNPANTPKYQLSVSPWLNAENEHIMRIEEMKMCFMGIFSMILTKNTEKQETEIRRMSTGDLLFQK